MSGANPLGDDHLYAASSKGRMKVLAAKANPLGDATMNQQVVTKLLERFEHYSIFLESRPLGRSEIDRIAGKLA